MNTEKIKDLINNSDMVTIQKNIAIGYLNRIEETENKRKEDRELIEQITKEKKISEVLYSSDEVKFYSVYGNEEWDIKYPIRFIFLNKNGVWTRSCTVSPNMDVAYLVYLEHKHLGSNSKFTDFALKMLEIKIEE